ncbi:MAG TPA: rhomboid family intramembrane serine protease, partial [Kofleriaceae bacterium]|nr:rhomboid family intramembrane serine protease [Kofleriaceae bacterium]
SPQLAVELVRAYCELGQLDRAAVLVERLERHRASARAAAGAAGGEGEAHAHAAEESIWHILVSRARLVFLAFVGRTAAVEAILAPRGPLGSMPESARQYWVGLVRLKAGDRTGARSSLERAAALSGRDGRARELAEATLSRIDEPGVAGPPQVSAEVAALADRLSRLAEDAPASPAGQGAPGAEGKPARRARAPRLQGVSWREVPVTTALLLANLAVTAAVYLLFGTFADLGALVQAGANLKSATAAGEIWRLATNMFLHVGLLHLALNMYGLWVLGRLVEQFLGSARTFAVYMAAGLVGSVASLLFGGPATSAGASGAVFGLLGAAAAELALHRKAYPRRWSGALLGNLLFLAAANVVIGFMYPIIDQSAHIGGMLTGALLGAALSRKSRVAGARWMRALVAALCAAGAGALGYGAVGVATADYGETLASAPRRQVALGGVALEAPAHWQVLGETELFDPGLVVVVLIERVGEGEATPEDVLAVIEKQREAERTRGAKTLGFTEARQASEPLLPVPPPWQSRELVATVEAGVGSGSQVHRIAVVGRPAPGGGVWLGAIFYPASLADELAPTLGEMLSSARPAPGGGAAAP